jgi:hypothetical protein
MEQLNGEQPVAKLKCVKVTEEKVSFDKVLERVTNHHMKDGTVWEERYDCRIENHVFILKDRTGLV